MTEPNTASVDPQEFSKNFVSYQNDQEPNTASVDPQEFRKNFVSYQNDQEPNRASVVFSYIKMINWI